MSYLQPVTEPAFLISLVSLTVSPDLTVLPSAPPADNMNVYSKLTTTDLLLLLFIYFLENLQQIVAHIRRFQLS